VLNTFTQSVLNRLPPEAQAKAIMLDHQRQAAHAALEAALPRLSDAHRRRDTMEASITAKIAATPADRRYPDEVDALMAPLTILDAEIAGLRAEVGRAERHFHNFDFLHDAAKWLADRDQAGRRFAYRKPSAPKGDCSKIVVDARTKIADIEAQIVAVELAPAPAADVREQVVAAIDKIAEQGRPRLDIRSPDGIGDAIARAVAVPGFAVYASRAALIEALTSDLTDAPGAMSERQKAEALASLNTERLDIERAEEAAIVAAEVAGTAIARRRAVDARALLNLEN
jgi:hypothetical protein